MRTSSLEKVIPGIDEEGTPPCETLRPPPDTCGKPSTWRLFGECLSCGNHGLFFVCDKCLRDMESNFAGCSVCGDLFNVSTRRI
jgi:hypothetical protein